MSIPYISSDLTKNDSVITFSSERYQIAIALETIDEYGAFCALCDCLFKGLERSAFTEVLDSACYYRPIDTERVRQWHFRIGKPYLNDPIILVCVELTSYPNRNDTLSIFRVGLYNDK